MADKWGGRCPLSRGPVFVTSTRSDPPFEDVICQHHINLVQRLYWHWTFGMPITSFVPSVRPIYWLKHGHHLPCDQSPISPPATTRQAGQAGRSFADTMWEFSRVCGTFFKERRRWHDNQIPERHREAHCARHSNRDLILDPMVGREPLRMYAKNWIGS